MKTAVIFAALLFAGSAQAQVIIPRGTPLSPPCSTSVHSATPVEGAAIALSNCGRRVWVLNEGAGNLFVDTKSLKRYVVRGGTARSMPLADNDTVMKLQTDAGTSSVRVEQCKDFCKW